MRIAHSTQKNSEQAAQEVAATLGQDCKLVLFFVSSQLDVAVVGKTLHGSLGGAQTLGCTTAGELVSGLMLEGSVVAMGLDSSEIADCALAVVAHDDIPKNVGRALDTFAQHFGVKMAAMNPSEYVGLALLDGLSLAEERVMDVLTDRSNVAFLGGSTADDLQFKTTHVLVNGQAHPGASALALLKPNKPFEIVKTQSFKILPQKLVATQVDESQRIIHAFNGKPAAQEYAKALGTSVAELPKLFMSNPLGLVMADGEPYVRSPRLIQGEAVAFYCSVKEGMELSVLETTNIVDDMKALLERLKAAGPISGIVNFHCILRTLQLKNAQATQAYGKLFEGVPMVGLSTYGEAYVGHINQTSTLLVLR